MSRVKGSVPWNKGGGGYTFKTDHRLANFVIDDVRSMILSGLSRKGILQKTGVTECTFYKYVNLYMSDLKEQLYQNGKNARILASKDPERNKKLSNSRRGKSSVLKGKNYIEIFKSEEKATKRKQHTSAWMKTERNIRRFCKKPSKPQLALYEKIKVKYSSATLEFPVKINSKKTIWLDIGIPELKLDFEYDGSYWHQLNGIENDNIRDQQLRDLGWTITRVSDVEKFNDCC